MSVTNIGEKLQFINDSFFASDIQTELLGKEAQIKITTNDHFMKSMFDYGEFTAKIVPATYTIDSTVLNRIYVKKGNANYTSINWSAPSGGTYTDAQRNGWSLTDEQLKNSEYNYSVLLQNMASLPNAYGPQFNATPINLLNILDRLRVVYHLLDPEVFADYQAQKQIGSSTLSNPIRKYSINASSGKSTTINVISDIEDMVRPFVDITKLNTGTSRIEMMRRILYLYDSLIHIYLGFYLLDQGVGNQNYRLPLYDITYYSIKLLFTRNDIIEDVGSNISTIQRDMQTRINTYNLSKEEIEKHAKLLKDNQSDIKIEQSKLDVRKYQEKKVSIVYYIYFVIFLICLISIGSVVWNTTLGDNIKRLIVSILGGISILGIVVLYLVNRYTLESFAGAVTISSALEVSVINGTSSFSTIRTNLLTDVYKACFEYLSNTMNIGLLINTYTSYGEMNYSIQKEKGYFDDKNNTLQTNKDLISHASNVIDLENKVKRFRVYYFIQLLITISVSAILIVYLPESSSITSLVLIIASVFILLFTYTYIVNVNNLVRTDATKIYWGQPDPKDFLY